MYDSCNKGLWEGTCANATGWCKLRLEVRAMLSEASCMAGGTGVFHIVS